MYKTKLELRRLGWFIYIGRSFIRFLPNFMFIGLGLLKLFLHNSLLFPFSFSNTPFLSWAHKFVKIFFLGLYSLIFSNYNCQRQFCLLKICRMTYCFHLGFIIIDFPYLLQLWFCYRVYHFLRYVINLEVFDKNE